MHKKIINTKNAPLPIGPYSQAILADDTLYCSGQIPVNPQTNELVVGSIAEQTHQVMKNIGAVLMAADMSFGNVVKTTIFLRDMNDFPKVNAIYGGYFAVEADGLSSEPYFPARETVEVSRLPKDVLVEISVVGVK